MLDYLILENKPKYKFKDIDETGMDLLHKTIDLSKPCHGDYLLVNEYYIARPDLISLAKYGDDQFGDIICKVNGISNPFELNEGMILFIPSANALNNILNHSDVNTVTKTIDNDEDENINKINKIGDQKKLTDLRSPAQQTEGDFNYILNKSLGIAIY